MKKYFPLINPLITVIAIIIMLVVVKTKNQIIEQQKDAINNFYINMQKYDSTMNDAIDTINFLKKNIEACKLKK